MDPTERGVELGPMKSSEGQCKKKGLVGESGNGQEEVKVSHADGGLGGVV